MNISILVATVRFAVMALTVAVSNAASAQETVHPETARMVKEAVEAYYETRPTLRPTAAWLASAPAPTCAKPRYPRAGLRDELEGTTVVRFDITGQGKPVNARVARSSGWAVLDEAALEALSMCQFPQQPDLKGQGLSYRFYLE